MKTLVQIVLALLCSFLNGCTTSRPDAEEMLDAIVMPEVAFREADVGDVICLLLSGVNPDPSNPPPMSITSPGAAKQQQERNNRKYARLREYCGDKTISMNLTNCSALKVLDLVTRYMGLKYEFEGNKILIKSAEGELLVTE